MKCPFRKITLTYSNVTEEKFGECYKEECPFYKKETTGSVTNGKYVSKEKEKCRRTK